LSANRLLSEMTYQRNAQLPIGQTGRQREYTVTKSTRTTLIHWRGAYLSQNQIVDKWPTLVLLIYL